jgi:hypothetical protein
VSTPAYRDAPEETQRSFRHPDTGCSSLHTGHCWWLNEYKYQGTELYRFLSPPTSTRSPTASSSHPSPLLLFHILPSDMFSHTFAAIFTLATLVVATPYDAMAPGTLSSLVRRDDSQVLVSCTQPKGTAPPPCVCPADLNGDTGVLINYYPVSSIVSTHCPAADPLLQGYQCAYPGGACTWQDVSGALQNTHQTNCPTVAPCPSTGCACPIDNNLDTGVLINVFKGYQCAYTGGACTWDSVSSWEHGTSSHSPDVSCRLALSRTLSRRTARLWLSASLPAAEGRRWSDTTIT